MRSNPCVRYAVRMKEGNDSVIRKKTGRSILKNLYSRGIHEAKKVEFFRHTGWDSACQRSGRTVGGDFFRFSSCGYFVLVVTYANEAHRNLCSHKHIVKRLSGYLVYSANRAYLGYRHLSFRPSEAQCRNLIFSGRCQSRGDIRSSPAGKPE